MCGRFVHHASLHAQRALADAVGATLLPAHALPPRYNLAPTQLCLAFVRGQAEPQRRSALLRFGMARRPNGLVLNARAETLVERPTFRPLLARHRCLVVASGFYEWQPPQGPGGRKTPYLFARADGAPFCFAALRARDPAGGDAGGRRPRPPAAGAPPAERLPEAAGEVALITCAANDVVAPVHGRMPVMLSAEAARAWLDWETDVETSLALLQPYAEAMRAHPVDARVNRPQHDAPDCLTPVPATAAT